MYSLLTEVHGTVVEVTFVFPASSWKASLLSNQSVESWVIKLYNPSQRDFSLVPCDVKSRQMNTDNLVLFWTEVAEMKK